jgi:hypothetical protein
MSGQQLLPAAGRTPGSRGRFGMPGAPATRRSQARAIRRWDFGIGALVVTVVVLSVAGWFIAALADVLLKGPS